MTAKKSFSTMSAGQIALSILKYGFLLGLTVVALVPFVWMISSSLKTSIDVFSVPMKWIPTEFHWDNYLKIWERVPLLVYFKNTAVLAIIVTFMQILTSSFAAYAFAKMNFKGRDLLFMCYIGTIAVPWQVYMVPQFIMMRSIGLYDTIWALVVLQSFTAFGVFLMRQFYMGIPNDLSEAARIDGANHFQVFGKIVLPLYKAGLATIGLFNVVGRWNDWFTGVLYIENPNLVPLQTLLQKIQSSIEFIKQNAAVAGTPDGIELMRNLPQQNLRMACMIIIILPVLAAYPFFQRYFVSGLTIGSVKE